MESTCFSTLIFPLLFFFFSSFSFSFFFFSSSLLFTNILLHNYEKKSPHELPHKHNVCVILEEVDNLVDVFVMSWRVCVALTLCLVIQSANTSLALSSSTRGTRNWWETSGSQLDHLLDTPNICKEGCIIAPHSSRFEWQRMHVGENCSIGANYPRLSIIE